MGEAAASALVAAQSFSLCSFFLLFCIGAELEVPVQQSEITFPCIDP